MVRTQPEVKNILPSPGKRALFGTRSDCRPFAYYTSEPSRPIHLNVHPEFDPGMVGKGVLVCLTSLRKSNYYHVNDGEKCIEWPQQLTFFAFRSERILSIVHGGMYGSRWQPDSTLALHRHCVFVNWNIPTRSQAPSSGVSTWMGWPTGNTPCCRQHLIGALDTWQSRDLRSAECASLTTRILHNRQLAKLLSGNEVRGKVAIDIAALPHAQKAVNFTRSLSTWSRKVSWAPFHPDSETF